MCERLTHYKENSALEASETVGPGSVRANIRRVFKIVGPHDERRSVIVCREVDTNLDGIKDVVRTFNDKGEPLHEESDTNYDGLVDDWITFVDGRISEEDEDSTRSTGRPNVWKFYIDGSLSRIRRNTHCPNGKPDTWEIYLKNRLERVGNDLTCDGHVDRWDRDMPLIASEETEAAAKADAGASSTATDGIASSLDGGTSAPDAGGRLRDGGRSDAATGVGKRPKAK
jgi:hypothetical protein